MKLNLIRYHFFKLCHMISKSDIHDLGKDFAFVCDKVVFPGQRHKNYPIQIGLIALHRK